MSWLERCYQTYEYIRRAEPDLIGRQEPNRATLLPVGHTTQQAQIQVELDLDGNFLNAFVLRKDEQTTIIPCTERSSARTSGIVPHPLADKLQYIASNYSDYGGRKEPGWEKYHEQLLSWCSSPFSHPLVCAVLHYLEKGCLIPDLLAKGILFTDETGRLPAKYTGEKDTSPQIVRAIPSGDQTESFIRFRVNNIDLSCTPELWDSFLHFYESQLTDQDYCTVLGEKTAISMLSPQKIRNAGDGAKLISSNDETNFTFRGRFFKPRQALSIGYRTTQEAHSALRWLISRQGTNLGDESILVWGTQDEPVPSLCDDTYDLAQNAPADDLDDMEIPEFALMPSQEASTAETIARQFNRAIHGYRLKLTDTSQLSVLILDSPSGAKGRLSVRYYQELSGSRLLENIVDWHKTFVWLLEYRSRPAPAQPGTKPKQEHFSFVGAPAPEDIAKAAYGEKVDQKLKQQTLERLVPCLVERKPLPYDLVRSAVRRATAGVTLEPWEARKTRSIACALICGYYTRSKGESYSMALDETCRDRSYLFGRILACAEQVERYAQNLTTDEKRTTNAERAQVMFVQRPAKTTVLLQNKLTPYLSRIQSKNGSRRRYQLMLDLIDQLGEENFTNKPLSELYLLGYSSQLMAFRRENEESKKNSNPSEE